MKIEDFQMSVVLWFRKQGRALPWRETRDPYKIWISEMMCQQTGVQTVIPYYHRFLKKFPSVNSLAKAKESEVLKLWEGLGYYSRARNLWKASKIIVQEFHSQFPSEYEDVIKLPGIGPYSARAILAIAHSKRQPALDGNLIRVYSRFYGIEEAVNKPKTLKRLWKIATDHVPLKREYLRDYTEGMMDLGATLCRPKNPDCQNCFLAKNCVAKRKSLQSELPRKTAARKREKHIEIVYWMEKKKKLALLKKGSDPKYPHFYRLPFKTSLHEPPKAKRLKCFRYSVTHRDFKVFVKLARSFNQSKQLKWVHQRDLKEILLPAVDRKIIADLRPAFDT